MRDGANEGYRGRMFIRRRKKKGEREESRVVCLIKDVGGLSFSFFFSPLKLSSPNLS